MRPAKLEDLPAEEHADLLLVATLAPQSDAAPRGAEVHTRLLAALDRIEARARFMMRFMRAADLDAPEVREGREAMAAMRRRVLARMGPVA